jgi:transaldolase
MEKVKKGCSTNVTLVFFNHQWLTVAVAAAVQIYQL